MYLFYTAYTVKSEEPISYIKKLNSLGRPHLNENRYNQQGSVFILLTSGAIGIGIGDTALTDGHKCLNPWLGLSLIKSTSPQSKSAKTLAVSGLQALYQEMCPSLRI